MIVIVRMVEHKGSNILVKSMRSTGNTTIVKLLLIQKGIAHAVYYQLILTNAKCGGITTKKLQVLISKFLTRSFVSTQITTVYQLLRFIVFVYTFQ